ncbi:hypothetical protein T10_5000 [Trichinella papuae]|uniref:Uncharacterized protein n=1 Tax=Trichinella papuae TaxID=268474 RepID=A0A0V1M112_9BILA|nr:hypothetical protein T10_5000 [Trichinella papuae]
MGYLKRKIQETSYQRRRKITKFTSLMFLTLDKSQRSFVKKSVAEALNLKEPLVSVSMEPLSSNGGDCKRVRQVKMWLNAVKDHENRRELVEALCLRKKRERPNVRLEIKQFSHLTPLQLAEDFTNLSTSFDDLIGPRGRTNSDLFYPRLDCLWFYSGKWNDNQHQNAVCKDKEAIGIKDKEEKEVIQTPHNCLRRQNALIGKGAESITSNRMEPE